MVIIQTKLYCSPIVELHVTLYLHDLLNILYAKENR